MCARAHLCVQPLVEWFERNKDDLSKKWRAFGLVFDFDIIGT
jgi:hypothetical protein